MKISITTECFYRLGIMLVLALGNAYIGYAYAYAPSFAPSPGEEQPMGDVDASAPGPALS